jgi:hypothetical protein
MISHFFLKKIEAVGFFMSMIGTIILSTGNAILAQFFYCFSNPLMGLVAWYSKNNFMTAMFLFNLVCSIRGVMYGF